MSRSVERDVSRVVIHVALYEGYRNNRYFFPVDIDAAAYGRYENVFVSFSLLDVGSLIISIRNAFHFCNGLIAEDIIPIRRFHLRDPAQNILALLDFDD